MKVFVSYSTAVDQIIALRLQTMAAVYGVTSYVPPATVRSQSLSQPYLELSPEVQKNLEDSDVVLAVITHQPVPSAIAEMNWAVTQRKLLIPIVGPGVPPQYYAQFGPVFVANNPADPSDTIRKIVQFLQQWQQTQSAKNALVALATLTVTLLLLGAVSSDT
jgi:hypothetical protein